MHYKSRDRSPKKPTLVEDAPVARRPAVLYARVSSRDQEREGFSIPAQQKAIHEYASSKGFHILEEFIDIETAKKSGRTHFMRMLAYVRKRHVNPPVVLVEKTDRLYRNFKDYVTIDELDVTLIFVKEGSVLNKDSRSHEKFIHGIKVLMAKNYIDNLSEETRKGMLEKAEQGIWPSVAPLGYRNVVGVDGKHVIEPVPDAAPIVTRLFESYATCRYSGRELTSSKRRAVGRRSTRLSSKACVSASIQCRSSNMTSSGCTWLSRSSKRFTASSVRWRRAVESSASQAGSCAGRSSSDNNAGRQDSSVRSSDSSLPVTFSRMRRGSSRASIWK